jgi:GTP-binding protein
VLDRDGNLVETGRVTKILAFRGIERAPIEEAEAGDIVAIAGLTKANVADTFCAPEVTEPLPAQPIDPPTLSMTFSVNDSPLAGTEGDKVTSRVIRDRLLREAEGNVALRVDRIAETEAFEVAGRGELQLGILIETMRREGFELSCRAPKVLFKTTTHRRIAGADRGSRHRRRRGAFRRRRAEDERAQGEMIEMRPSGGGKLRLVFYAPTRGLIGYQGELLTDTRGTAIMNRCSTATRPGRATRSGGATAC